jgi:hypothetical protein
MWRSPFDWDHLGTGSPALDLTSLLFDWQRLRLGSEGAVVSDGGERLVRRIMLRSPGSR